MEIHCGAYMMLSPISMVVFFFWVEKGLGGIGSDQPKQGQDISVVV